MRFIATPFVEPQQSLTTTLATTERFVVISEDEFTRILAAVNMASLLMDQIAEPRDLDGNLMPPVRVKDVIGAGQDGLSAARYMQIVIS